MRFESLTDPAEFQRRTVAVLADEARHNLIRGILGNLVRDRNAYEEFRLFTVLLDSEVVATALMTKPYNLIVADTREERAVAELVAGLVANGVEVPGIIGNRPTVDWFVAEWEKVTGESAKLGMEQGVFAIERVIPARIIQGSARPARLADADLLLQWLNEFAAEALPDEPRDDARLREMVDKRLAGEGSGDFWLWDVNGEPKSMSSYGSPTGSGIRIGAVYTPPPLRGHGCASALVAAQSGWLLDNGYESCFLFTDAANPTSNAIYERIGYKRVAAGASYTFAPVSPGA